jgi:DNA-binding MarR family transcriptional regulator
VQQDEVDVKLASLRAEAPEIADAVELSKRIGLLAGLLRRATQAELDELGLTYAEFDVLASLGRGGKPYRDKPNELAKALSLTTGGISNVVQRLENAGLVVREVDPADARSRWVRLTPEGLKLSDRAVRQAGRAQADALAKVPDKSVRHAADSLREVVLALGSRGKQGEYK